MRSSKKRLRVNDRLTLQCTFMFFVLGWVMGCDPVPLPRLPITGSVKVLGVEIEKGMIRLEPIGGSGPSASTKITDNRFTFQATDGPQPGSYRVVVQQVPKVEAKPSSKQELPSREEPMHFDESLEENLVWVLRSLEISEKNLSYEIVIDPDQ